MRIFRNVVNEIRRTVAQILILPSLLNGIIVFLALYLPVGFFNLNMWLALGPAIAYTAYLIWREIGVNKLKLVERFYPNLNEKLITAADYADVNDVMVNELHKEVIKEVRDVATSAFVNRKSIFLKVGVCIVLSFLLLSVTHFHLDSTKFKLNLQDKITELTHKVLSDEGRGIIQINDTGNMTASGSGAGVGINTNIFGDKYLAQLGEEQVEVEIKPTTLEFKIGEVKDAEKKDFEDVFPEEIFLETSASYEENIPRDQQELVKNYFKKITET